MNINHFSSVSDSLGRLAAASKCMAIVEEIHQTSIFSCLIIFCCIYIYNSILIWGLTILKSGARTPRTVTKFAVKTAIDMTQTI